MNTKYNKYSLVDQVDAAKEARNNLLIVIVSYVFVIPWLGGAIFDWFNYLTCVTQLGYWRWVVIATFVIWATNTWLKFLKPVYGLMLFAAVLVQILAWMSVVELPLVK